VPVIDKNNAALNKIKSLVIADLPESKLKIGENGEIIKIN
jgi:hypothetical protein